MRGGGKSNKEGKKERREGSLKKDTQVKEGVKKKNLDLFSKFVKSETRLLT